MADWQDEARAAKKKKDEEEKKRQEESSAKKAIVKNFWDKLIIANEILDHDIRLSTGKMELLIPKQDDYGNWNGYYNEGIVNYIASNLNNRLLFYDPGQNVIAEGHSSGGKIHYKYVHEVKPIFTIESNSAIILFAWVNSVYEDKEEFLWFRWYYEIDSTSIDKLLKNLSLGHPMQAGLKEIKQDEKGQKTGNCFIATSVYGSRFSPEVITLQDLRDQVLLNNFLGAIFVQFYYLFSPPIAKIISDRRWLQDLVKKGFLQFCVLFAQRVLKSKAVKEDGRDRGY